MAPEKAVPLLQAQDHDASTVDDAPPVLTVVAGRAPHPRSAGTAHPSLRETAGRAWTGTRGILHDLMHDDTAYVVDHFPGYRDANLEIHRVLDTIHRFDR
jgi:hypothetical protein